MKEENRVVSVRWLDITGHDEVPSTETGYKKLLARCESIGRLIYRDDEILVISNRIVHIPGMQGEGEDIHRDIMIIPQGVILRIEELSKSKKENEEGKNTGTKADSEKESRDFRLTTST